MPDDAAKMLDRIQKLLAKAESTTFDEEAEALTEKAYALMAKHAIDEAMIAGHSASKTDEIIIHNETFTGAYRPENAALFVSIGHALGFRCIQNEYRKSYGYGDNKIESSWVGWKSEIDAALMLFASVSIQATQSTLRWRKANVRHLEVGPGVKTKMQRSYMLGYADTIGRRLEETRRMATAEATEEHGTGVELVLVDRTQQVDDYISRTMQLVPNRSRGRTVDHGSYQAGKVDANSASIHRATPSSPRAIA